MRFAVIVSLVIVGLLSFGALITLSGFAGDLRDKSPGKAHALSQSAIGYAGLVQLLSDQGWETMMIRQEDPSSGRNSETYNTLEIATLSTPGQLRRLEDMQDFDSAPYAVVQRRQKTVYVLPKWNVLSLDDNPRWVKPNRPPFGPTHDLGGLNRLLNAWQRSLTITRRSATDLDAFDVTAKTDNYPTARNLTMRYLQTFEPGDYDVLMRADDKPVLIRMRGSGEFVLSDPDFLNTQGIATRSRAQLAQDILTAIIYDQELEPRALAFNLHMHGFGETQNLIKLLLTPPFLGATLCLLLAGLLVGWQAFARFGDPVPSTPDFALGKYTLVDNAARFIRIANKETDMADGYINLIRRKAASALNASGKSVEDTDKIFEARENRRALTHPLKHTWRARKGALAHAQTKNDSLSAAQYLHDWKEEISHEPG